MKKINGFQNLNMIQNFIQNYKSIKYSKKLCIDLIENAEKIITECTDNKLLQDFLDISSKSNFLQSLETRENRLRWSELAFKIIQKTEYGLLNMLEQRVAEHPNKVLFQDMSGTNTIRWTYQQVYSGLQEIAAFIYSLKKENPRVAIFMSNSVDAASVDLACLCFDIFDTPLNIHFSSDILAYIFDELKIDFLITDSKERLRTAKQAAKKSGRNVKFIVTNRNISGDKNILNLKEESKKLSRKSISEILKSRKRKSIKQVATTMFTSGSTGKPKGVSFSIYNIVSKRFARGSAVPKVGNSEVLLCFLPLFHTFGRFLEMTGSIYWSATYIFAGNTSSATLLKLFPKVNPSVFISVPIRWVQLYEKCMKEIKDIDSPEEINKTVRKIIGKKLKWGLSAAGYLDPKIFRFFERQGVDLCSGFGMTEATGGITMTLPGEYIEDSTGIALPGVKTFLKETGELCIKGHYIAKYLDNANPEQNIEYPDKEEHIIETGDIFEIHKGGHHQIIDRVKDIYKNNKGQTVAPGMIEKKFAGVPGIKKAFLVGDGKPYNVLLIVPDKTDNVVKSISEKNNLEQYFHQIIMSANKDLAPYERIINFNILDRDFSEEKNELTAKGSYKRNEIRKNYSKFIEKLYITNKIILRKDNFNIIIPRWFFRDIGILETDICITENGIKNKVNKLNLRIEKGKNQNSYTIGDLEYTLTDNNIDLGRLVRQAKLWTANPQLIEFSPCKASFDLPLMNFKSNISLPKKRNIYKPDKIKHPQKINDAELIFLNEQLSIILHSEDQSALQNLQQIELQITEYGKNFLDIVCKRLSALAWHKNKQIRFEAYKILISNDIDIDFSKILPDFINSGKVFMDNSTIHLISKTNIERFRLDALRRSMHVYRETLKWPATPVVIKQFETIFNLFLDLGKKYPKYYSSIRSEFASWMMLKEAPKLSAKAEDCFDELKEEFEKNLNKKSPQSRDDVNRLLFFDEGISNKLRITIKEKLCCNNFLKRSIFIVFDEENFDLEDIPDFGIWISKIRSYTNSMLFRMSINTKQGKHFDLHISIDERISTPKGKETIIHHLALAQYPYIAPVLGRFGCIDIENNIFSAGYLSELSAWEKIRSLAELQTTTGLIDDPNIWRRIFIKSMVSFYKAWNYFNYKTVPGYISPTNVVVPESDFAESAKIISLAGYKETEKIIPFFKDMLQNFYFKTEAHYPQLEKHLHRSWIFHACSEALGDEKTIKILTKLKNELKANKKLNKHETNLYKHLKNYLKNFGKTIYLPLALFNAIDRYSDWIRKNPVADATAKQQTISELSELYKLKQFPEIVRYKFYRETYFKSCPQKVKKAFDILLQTMQDDIHTIPIQLIELSDLQETLEGKTGRAIFGKMVFPDISEKQKVEIIKVGEKKDEHVVVRSVLKDKKDVEYIMREPQEPSEVGELYKLFFQENYPKKISKIDKHFVVTDANERVIGGLCYKMLDNNIVLLDGTAVTSPLHGRGIGTFMIDDFFIRMTAKGVKFIKAHFLFGNYYMKHNFKIDKKWGALVKEL